MKETADKPTQETFAPLISFLAAVQFLTVAPPIVQRPFKPHQLGQAVAYFPLVGLLLGGILAGGYTVLSRILPLPVTAVLTLALWVLLTGALHLDGFLDACDGLFGGQTSERRLQIMRDEQVGAFALAGGVLLLLLKHTLLASLPGPVPALLLAPTLGRWSLSLAIVRFPYARTQGLGRTMKDQATWQQLLLATTIAITVAGISGRWLGLVALAVVAAGTWATSRFVLRRIPGLTGDIYGGLCEIGETLVLLTFVAADIL